MTLAESLLVSLYGFAIVFAVLVALSFLLDIQAKLVRFFEGKKKQVSSASEASTTVKAPSVEAPMNPVRNVPMQQTGELRLVGVDEKTAAMIMAIVSDESHIPLSQLIFKSIKALD